MNDVSPATSTRTSTPDAVASPASPYAHAVSAPRSPLAMSPLSSTLALAEAGSSPSQSLLPPLPQLPPPLPAAFSPPTSAPPPLPQSAPPRLPLSLPPRLVLASSRTDSARSPPSPSLPSPSSPASVSSPVSPRLEDPRKSEHYSYATLRRLRAHLFVVARVSSPENSTHGGLALAYGRGQLIAVYDEDTSGVWGGVNVETGKLGFFPSVHCDVIEESRRVCHTLRVFFF